MDSALRAEYREYAWKYFALHADQRLKAFNFFIVIVGFLTGAFCAIIANKGIVPLISLLPTTLVFISFVFWKLEERTRMLVKNGEAALKLLDQDALANETKIYSHLALFTVDDENTSRLRKSSLLSAHFSYSRCFRWVYGASGLLGVVGTVVCWFSKLMV